MIGMQNADNASNLSYLVTEETQPRVGNDTSHDSPPAEISDESVNTPAEVSMVFNSVQVKLHPSLKLIVK